MARPRIHLLVTAVALGCLNRRLTAAQHVGALVGGVLVDADHLLDYWLYHRVGYRKWVVLPLHGWEFVLALLVGVGSARYARLSRVVGVSLLVHLIIDVIANRPERAVLYSFTYRLRHGFQATLLQGSPVGSGGWVRRPWWSWL